MEQLADAGFQEFQCRDVRGDMGLGGQFKRGLLSPISLGLMKIRMGPLFRIDLGILPITILVSQLSIRVP